MTFQQLKLASIIAAKGSISAAAQAMKISQPNASQAIRKLEKELGYRIFKRSEDGMIPTDSGYRFLSYAERILVEKEAIKVIGKETCVPRLRVGIMNYTPAVQAFVQFCSENQNASLADLICLNVNTDTGVRMLKERLLDIVVSLQLKNELSITTRLCTENRLKIEKMGNIPLCVRVRKDHPLVLSGELDGTAAGFNKLKKYPYVDYLEYRNLLPTFIPSGGAPFGYTYAIYTDERESRMTLMGATDAYTVGVALPQKRLDQYGLVSVPIGNEHSTLIAITRDGANSSPNVKEYLELLRQEIV